MAVHTDIGPCAPEPAGPAVLPIRGKHRTAPVAAHLVERVTSQASAAAVALIASGIDASSVIAGISLRADMGAGAAVVLIGLDVDTHPPATGLTIPAGVAA
jgi:hypothetical protein